MLDTDVFKPRPSLTNPQLLARALDALGQSAQSQVEIWRRLTDRFAVDLDAVASLLPDSSPQPVWLKASD